MGYMIDRIADSIIQGLDVCTDEYVQGLYANLQSIIELSNIPVRLQMDYIDIKKAPKSYKELYKKFPEILQSSHSVIVKVANFDTSTGYMSASLMEQIMTNYIKSDEHIPIMLYIDTPVLLADYGHIMDNNTQDGVEFSIYTPANIIYDLIYRADFIFWDKFDYSTLGFASRKLVEVLTVRYNRCLNNLFFVSSSIEQLVTKYDSNFCAMMDAKSYFDLADVNATNLSLKEGN